MKAEHFQAYSCRDSCFCCRSNELQFQVAFIVLTIKKMIVLWELKCTALLNKELKIYIGQ